MKQVFVLAEHRQGRLRDNTWEALSAGKKIAEALGAELACLLTAANCPEMAQELAKECPKVITVEDAKFETFNSEAITAALPKILPDSDYILLIGNSNSVIDLAPGLSVVLNAALATDCIGLDIADGAPVATRQAYSYKVNTQVSFKNAEKVIVTLRAGHFPFTPAGSGAGQIESVASPLADLQLRKRFVDYVEAEKGAVDIASADVLVSLGRGIGDEPDMEIFESLAKTMGGELACSRPIVDKSILPKYHQVGTSGIEVKPKVYLALGISGAFQHIGGIKGSPLIVAVNKDPRAPIFQVAQYGIVGDVNQVVPALEEKIKEKRK
jgi:electron transfer flavoprotein alpha subunit